MTTESQTVGATESSQAIIPQTTELNLDTEQQLGLALCMDMSKRLVAITGAAGTGKTTLLKTGYKEYTDSGYSVKLAAPTGKAAKRIEEVTGFPASTVHRLLEFSHPGEVDEKTGKVYGDSVPKRNMNNPLDCDVLFVDEYTMVNQNLHRDILDAMKPGSILRCFGVP